MSETVLDRADGLLDTIGRLSRCTTLKDLMSVTVAAARNLLGADGVTFVLRDGDLCYYAEEEAIGELWRGRRFPMNACISGWVMQEAQGVVAPDIYADPRIPQDAYRPTFVRSLVMAPVGHPAPIAALGAYWSSGDASRPALALLQQIADASALAVQNLELRQRQLRCEESLADLLDHCATGARQGHLGVVAQLTAGVAHNFNNLLTVIEGSIDELEDGAPVAEPIRRLRAAAERGGALVAKLLEFASEAPTQRLAHDLFVAAVRVAKTAEQRLAPCKVRIAAPPRPAWALVEGAVFEAALYALLANAAEAMPGGGEISVSVSVEPAGDWVVVEVKDQGTGFAPEAEERAFEPFFSTKAGAAGLGLPIVEGLMRRAGGVVTLSPAQEGGARVQLRIPAAVNHPLPVG
ncbi:MAG: sensor histidine kinase [Pseudomonadota bacterium]